MKFVQLPAKTQKNEANTIEITNRKLDATSEEGKKFVIPAEQFSYPQVESLAEFIQISGSEERAIEVVNEHLRDSAMAEAKNRIRMASTGTDEQIIAAGVSVAKNYTFVPITGPSAAEAKEKFANLKDLASRTDLSEADLLAAVRASLGL